MAPALQPRINYRPTSPIILSSTHALRFSAQSAPRELEMPGEHLLPPPFVPKHSPGSLRICNIVRNCATRLFAYFLRNVTSMLEATISLVANHSFEMRVGTHPYFIYPSPLPRSSALLRSRLTDALVFISHSSLMHSLTTRYCFYRASALFTIRSSPLPRR